MRVIITTSDRYHHLIPIFEYLYKKYWNDGDIELVGYSRPDTSLPFHSLGVQCTVNEWSTDLRTYFEKQDDHFIWCMEDTFIKRSINHDAMIDAIALTVMPTIGRIGLTKDIINRPHRKDNGGVLWAEPDSRYRLSTQPSIWNRDFLLKYLTPGLSPWEFETQDPVNDDWDIAGLVEPPIVHNEGVRRHDIRQLDLNGMEQDDIDHVKTLCTWL